MSSPKPYGNVGAAAPESLQWLIEMPEHGLDIKLEMSFALASAGSSVSEADVSLSVRRREDPPEAKAGSVTRSSPIARLVRSEAVPQLRWLLAQAGGTVAHVGYRLESCLTEIDDRERAQLLADTLALEDELETLKELIRPQVDWDAEYGRLLRGELPSLEADPDLDD